MRQTITLVIIALFAMVLVGCAIKDVEPDRGQAAPAEAADAALPGAGASADAQEAVDELGQDLAEIDTLDDDFAELESLEGDLDFNLE